MEPLLHKIEEKFVNSKGNLFFLYFFLDQCQNMKVEDEVQSTLVWPFYDNLRNSCYK